MSDKLNPAAVATRRIYDSLGQCAGSLSLKEMEEIITTAHAVRDNFYQRRNERLVGIAEEMISRLGSDEMSIQEYRRWQQIIKEAKKKI